MKITYYLNEGRKKNLYCRISDGTERVTFSMEHYVDPNNWDSRQGKGKCDDEYTYTLIDFKNYLTTKYLELKNANRQDVLNILKNEAQIFLDGSGIEGVARKMFDFFNKDTDLPKYDEFVEAFKKYSSLKRDKFKVQVVGHQIHFHTKDDVLVMDTYQGKTLDLKSMVDDKSYEEIFIMTNLNIWNEIYIDPGIAKHAFLPVMYSEWENYWSTTYKDIRERVGSTKHLDSQREVSWKQFQVFMASYDSTSDIIRLAYEVDDSILYPVAVLTMLQTYDAGTCYGEYCEHEFFGGGDWESVDLGEDRGDAPVFFVCSSDF